MIKSIFDLPWSIDHTAILFLYLIKKVLMPTFTLLVNQKQMEVEAAADTPMLWILRDELDLKGTKFGCGMAQCGACTIHLNGAATRSCTLPVSAVGESAIVTIEGLLVQEDQLHPVQQAWIEEDVAQCGYCQAGQIMSAAALLNNNATPTEAQIENAMWGNICRCGTYPRIKKAIQRAIQINEAEGR